jgi:glycosyltransferase involved in cell wall biosynthesis
MVYIFQQMRILIISHSCVEASISQQFYAQVERQTGWHLTIVTPSYWKDEYRNKRTPQRWHEYQGQLLSIPVWNSGSVPLHVYCSVFIRLLQKLQPDFIYVYQEPYAIATNQVYLANCLTIKKPIGFFTWQNIFKRYPFPFRQMEGWVLQQSSVIFPASYSAEAVFRKKGYQGDSVILPSGVDPNIYFPQSEAEELKNKIRNTENEILIGYVGRIVEQKGLKTLLYGLKQIQELPWRLIVIGAGSYEAEFEAIAQNLQLTHRISRLGYIPNVETPLYLSAFDVLVLPSETRANWKEQFGRVIIEAMACSTPVIGSDSGEIPHLLRATGGGLIFQEGQPEALANQLQQLILNPSLRAQLAEQGRQSVRQNYTQTLLARRFAEAVEKTVTTRQSAVKLLM